MKPSQTRAQKWTRVIYTLVLLSFILPVGYLIYRLIFWDEAAAQATEHGEPNEADGVEPALAGHERAGQAADGDGSEVKSRGKRHGDVGAEVFKEVWHGFLHKGRGG